MPSNAQGITYGQPNHQHQQLSVPRPTQAQHSGDVRAQVLNVLATTANSCLVEQGFDPRLAKRIEELEFERLRIFEDNKNLKMMLDNEKSKNQHLPKPHNELISAVVNSQNDLKRVGNENAALRTENSALLAKLRSLEHERGVQNTAHQQFQTSYNDLSAAYQNAVAKLANTEKQLNALAVHCRGCPEYARQIQAFKSQSGVQLQMVSPTQLHQFLNQHQQPQQSPPSQAHEQQRRASAPDTNVGSRSSSQPRFPATPTPAAARMGPPFQAVPRPSHDRSGSATNLRAATSSAPGPTPFPVPSPTISGPQAAGFIAVSANTNSTSMPMNSQPRVLQQPIPAPLPSRTLFSGSQIFNAPADQVLHNVPPQMQHTHPVVPMQSRPSSTLGHALDPNFNSQTQRSASHPPNQAQNAFVTRQPTPGVGTAISAPTMASLQPVVNNPDPWTMVGAHLLTTQKRPPSVISVGSTSRASSVASVTRPQTRQEQQQSQNASTMPASSAPPPALNSQPASSDAQPSAVPSVPPPSLSSTSSELARPAPRELTTSSQSSAPLPSPFTPSSGVNRVTDNDTSARMAVKRSSVVLGEPSMLPEGKKMRLSGEGPSASASPAPMQATEGENGGGVAAATAPEGQQEGPEDEDEEEEEDIAVGPDGLRLVSDCLASLFEINEAGARTCRLCKTRHARGLVSEAPAPFVNALDELLVQHCISEHEQVWNELRHDV